MGNTLGELIHLYARLDSEIDEREAATDVLRKQREECKAAIKGMMEVPGKGQDKATAAGLTFSMVTKDRAKYDPGEWPNIVKWAVETGNDHIIQRRLTDAKVVELIANGVALPWGLTVESYRDVQVRRVR